MIASCIKAQATTTRERVEAGGRDTTYQWTPDMADGALAPRYASPSYMPAAYPSGSWIGIPHFVSIAKPFIHSAARQGLRRTKYLDTWLTGTIEQQKPRHLLFINN